MRPRCTTPSSRHRSRAPRHRPAGQSCRSPAPGGVRPTSTPYDKLETFLFILPDKRQHRRRPSPGVLLARELRRENRVNAISPHMAILAPAAIRPAISPCIGKRPAINEKSTPQAEPADHAGVAVGICALQVIEQPAALPHHNEEAAP